MHSWYRHDSAHPSTYWSLCVQFHKWLITRDYLLTSLGATSSFNHLQTLLKTFPPFTEAAGVVVVVVGCSRWQLTDSGAVSICTPEPQTETSRKGCLWHTVYIHGDISWTCKIHENLSIAKTFNVYMQKGVCIDQRFYIGKYIGSSYNYHL